MKTMGEIVEEFNKLCQDIVATLPELVREFANAGQNNLYLQVSDSTIEDISIWWDATNKADFHAQQDYIAVLGEQVASEMLDSGFRQLAENPVLLDQFQSEQELAIKSGFDDFYYERLIPHQVGVDHMDYGQRLRDTIGYRELAGVLQVIQVAPTIHFTTEPTAFQLRSAFRLCLDLVTTNDKSIAISVGRGQLLGLFPEKLTRS